MPTYTKRLLRARTRLQMDRANEQRENWPEKIEVLGIDLADREQHFDYSLLDSYTYDGVLR